MTSKIAHGLSIAHPPPRAGEGDRVSGGGGATHASARANPIRPNEAKACVRAKALRRSMTHAEVLLWQELRHDAVDGLRFRRQHPIGPYVADFACAPIKLVVEIDGATHGSDAQVAHDRRRSAYFARLGWREIRFSNFDVYEDLPGVMEAIWRQAQRSPATAAARRSPSPARGEDNCGEAQRCPNIPTT